MKVLAVIPARGGSKGIPKKNIRLMNGKPLIVYSIENALKCSVISDVVVTTDDEEIAEVASNYGAEVIIRSKDLAADDVTLDPVVYDAVIKAEELHNCIYDYVITMQPTSPLLKCCSVEKAFKEIKDIDCLISVICRPHLSWSKKNDEVVPNYDKRLNRQMLPASYEETGAFVISKRNIIKQSSRISGRIKVYQISDQEGIDIDNTNDWILCETLFRKKRVMFRMDGYSSLGMGHVYNCISLAYSMMEHEILLVIGKESEEGIKKIKETNLPYKVLGEEKELEELINEFKPDIFVNDRLDTSSDYIKYLKKKVNRVVTIEDLGEGVKYADAVINALYTEDKLFGKNIYSGWEYVCLRDEFQIEKANLFSEEVTNIMLMFGGTDPSNYNKMLYDVICQISPKYPNISFNFVVGIGYDIEKNSLFTIEDKRIYVFPNVQRVTKYMKKADIAITSQGRAIFEFAAMGVPSIVLSHNTRESWHSFANMKNGFINLGIGKEISPEVIGNTLDWLITTKAVRKNMYDIMLQYPLRDGLSRVKSIIIGEE